MSHALSDDALDQIFRAARTQNAWRDEPMTEADLHAIYDLMKWGPTSANNSPARFLVVRSDEAKARIKPLLMEGNVDKSMTAPALVVFAHDLEFYEKIPQLFPHNPGARDWFTGSAEFAEQTAFRNGTLQAAYFMIAARAVGFDCAPMSGFDNSGVDKEFFGGTTWRSNFICAIGHGDHSKVHPRGPRLSFDEACQVL